MSASIRADGLDSAFKIVDEIDSVTNGEPRGARPQGRTDSVSTRPFGHDDHRDYADARMEAMERNMATIVQTLQELRLNQDQRLVTNHASRGRHLSECAPASRHHHSQDDFVRDHLARERMEIPSYEGKQYAGDIFTMQLIPKPYMFVKKLSGSSLKKKQDYRQNITATEYVDAFMAMLCDYRAREPADLLNQMKHLHNVTTDIMSRPWSCIRKWSQFVFDEIEKGEMAWGDKNAIQFVRCQFSFAATSPTDSVNRAASTGTGTSHLREVICSDYNNRSCSFGGKF